MELNASIMVYVAHCESAIEKYMWVEQGNVAQRSTGLYILADDDLLNNMSTLNTKYALIS